MIPTQNLDTLISYHDCTCTRVHVGLHAKAVSNQGFPLLGPDITFMLPTAGPVLSCPVAALEAPTPHPLSALPMWPHSSLICSSTRSSWRQACGHLPDPPCWHCLTEIISRCLIPSLWHSCISAVNRPILQWKPLGKSLHPPLARACITLTFALRHWNGASKLQQQDPYVWILHQLALVDGYCWDGGTFLFWLLLMLLLPVSKWHIQLQVLVSLYHRGQVLREVQLLAADHRGYYRRGAAVTASWENWASESLITCSRNGMAIFVL